MGSTWAQSTKETYGVGLLVFHIYCNLNLIEERKCCPVSSSLLLQFLSSCTGAYSGSAIANFTAGIKAWHLLHSRLWLIRPGKLKAALKGALTLALPASKCPKIQPFTSDFLSSICNHLNLDDLLDAAVFACITMTFYCIVRLGEFTTRTVKSFNSKKHITRAGMTESSD
jgi:hypothetical protein